METHVDILNVYELLAAMPPYMTDDMRRVRVKHEDIRGDHSVLLAVEKCINAKKSTAYFCFRVDEDGILRIWRNVYPKVSRWKIGDIREAVRQHSDKKPPIGSLVASTTDNGVIITASYGLSLTNHWFDTEHSRYMLTVLIVNTIEALYWNAARAVAVAENV